MARGAAEFALSARALRLTGHQWGRSPIARSRVRGSCAIKWNFTKFLVGRDGKTIRRYGPQTTPAAIEADIAEPL